MFGGDRKVECWLSRKWQCLCFGAVCNVSQGQFFFLVSNLSQKSSSLKMSDCNIRDTNNQLGNRALRERDKKRNREDK